MKMKDHALDRTSGKKESMAELSKLGISGGKRAGPSTPPPTWRFDTDNFIDSHFKTPTSEFLKSSAKIISARKLGAKWWELQPHHPSVKMRKRASKLLPEHETDGRGVEFDADANLLHQPETPSSLRKHVVTSRMQDQSVKRNGHAIQPISPVTVSYSSSMQMEPYNAAVTHSSPLDNKRRIGDSSYSLKTSSELLKVLNGIWALEEQHASNMALVKALKKEVDCSHARIKELLVEKQTDRQAMDDLKKIAEDRLIRKSKEHDRVKAAIQSVKDELENQRKLRKHSENLHRKQAEELSQAQFSLSNALKELESERKTRILLEKLCDAFAKGIKDYEKEVRIVRHEHETGHVDMEKHEKLILHISEGWLDERMQTKHKGNHNNGADMDKLSLEIETFLQAKSSTGDRKNPKLARDELEDNCLLQHSLESFPLNEAVSAPQEAADDGEDSCDSDSDDNNEVNGKEDEEAVISRSQIEKATPEHANDRQIKGGGCVGLSTDRMFDKLVRNKSENSSVRSAVGGPASPVGEWEAKLKSIELKKSRSSLGFLQAIHENSLKAKLLEARLESRQLHAKGGRGSI